MLNEEKITKYNRLEEYQEVNNRMEDERVEIERQYDTKQKTTVNKDEELKSQLDRLFEL